MRIRNLQQSEQVKQDTENQLAQLREFAAKQGWEVVREYVDYESGARAERPEFQQMFEDASRRKFDLLLFWALDRLSRKGVLETLQYHNRLTGYGVGFRSFTEQFFDSCGVFKDAIIAIMATLAKQERVKRSQNAPKRVARVRAAGRVLGRPAKLNGHRLRPSLFRGPALVVLRQQAAESWGPSALQLRTMRPNNRQISGIEASPTTLDSQFPPAKSAVAEQIYTPYTP